MVNDRNGLIVWMRSLKQVKSLRRYGNIHYVSKSMKYVVLYCDAQTCNDTANQLNSMSYVNSVQKSQRSFLKTNFENPKWESVETQG